MPPPILRRHGVNMCTALSFVALTCATPVLARRFTGTPQFQCGCRSSEASLGPPSPVAGLGSSVRAAGWPGRGPRLASGARGCAAMSAR